MIVKKLGLKEIATLTAAGKLSVAVGSAQAQECTTFINLELVAEPSFITLDSSEEGGTESAASSTAELTFYTQGQESGSTIAFAIEGLPDIPGVDIAVLVSSELLESNPAPGCFGSYLLGEDAFVVSGFSTSVTDIPGAEALNLVYPENDFGEIPEGNGPTVDEVVVLVNLKDDFADQFEDDFYVQALAIPTVAGLDLDESRISNIVHVTLNRTDEPPSSGDSKGGDSDDGDDMDPPPTDGKAT